MKSLSLIAACAVLATASPGFAAPRNDRDETGDPNRRICRTEEVIGSRLAKTKRCMTAAQWSEMKRDNKMAIERVQAARYKNE